MTECFLIRFESIKPRWDELRRDESVPKSSPPLGRSFPLFGARAVFHNIRYRSLQSRLVSICARLFSHRSASFRRSSAPRMRRRGLDSAPISSCAIAGNPGHHIPIIVVVCVEPRLPTDLQQQQQRGDNDNDDDNDCNDNDRSTSPSCLPYLCIRQPWKKEKMSLFGARNGRGRTSKTTSSKRELDNCKTKPLHISCHLIAPMTN